MSSVAKVAIVSNLPQLDKLFDYEIPDHLLESISEGSRVKVPFGKGEKVFVGFVLEIGTQSEFKGKLSVVQEVIGAKPSLDRELIKLIIELATRSAVAVGEILKIAVPAHMPRSEKDHEVSKHNDISDKQILTELSDGYISSLVAKGTRHAVLTKPAAMSVSVGPNEASYPAWALQMCQIARENLLNGRSTILAVPDFRDSFLLEASLDFCGLGEYLANLSQEQTKSEMYEGYLRALDSVPRIIIGSRSSVLAPAHNLGSIVIYDEGDRSFTDQASPFLNTREAGLVRQSIQECSIVFLSNSRSTDVQRLVETGYLQESSPAFAKPKISVSEPGFRVDSLALTAIRTGLAKGSVLVQVANKGESTALFCARCDERLSCVNCAGPVWVDASGQRKCRWCNAFASDRGCSCGGYIFSKGRAGSTRTASELGKSFPNAQVIESTGENRVLQVSTGSKIVISTAGAEPFVDGGYRAVILLDARTLLSRQYLRASEEAIRLWANAISKMARDGEGVLVGASGFLVQKFCLWQHVEIAGSELISRRELYLPPAVRLGSVAGSQELLAELADAVSKRGAVTVLGPTPFQKANNTTEWRLIFKYNYSDSVEFAKFLRGEVVRLTMGKSVMASSGRPVRALMIRMNDTDVI